MRIIIAGGGTGGHLFPALALAEEIKAMDAGAEIIFVGTRRGLEAKLVPAHGYGIEFLDVLGLKKKTKLEKVRAFIKAVKSTFDALKMMRRLRPDGVMGSGGYSSGPVVLAAALLGIKTAILEQNALPGLTNRILGKVAGRIYIAFPEAARFFPAARTLLSGNPVRKGILGIKDDIVGKKTKFSLLVFGGSQGATAVNAAFLDTAEYLTDIWDGLRVVHQTGRDGFEKTKEAYKRKGINAELHDFIDDMAGAYAGCDLVICRAGATSIAEITALGIPAILIPYPFSADGHQEVNAASLVKTGAAIMIRQDELTGNVLGAVIRRLFANPIELRKMREGMKKIGRPEASKVIALDYTGFLAQKR
ncbi:MAG: undecaprenyldiphospho-muramoylpentapeptide beta-N-acetylglucosaminyltransferase [Thermodesulfobacteriota bacterium]